MLTLEQKTALRKVREISNEIDIPNTIDNLRWAVSNLAHLAKESKPDDVALILNQIEAITDCMSWACQIYDCGNDLDRADRDAKNMKGGARC